MRNKHVVMLSICLVVVSCLSAEESQETLSFVCTSRACVGYGVCVESGYAYVTNNDGVIIFDIQKPGHPQKVGEISTGVAFGICVEQGFAYILGMKGLVIADVRDPVNPGGWTHCLVY